MGSEQIYCLLKLSLWLSFGSWMLYLLKTLLLEIEKTKRENNRNAHELAIINFKHSGNQATQNSIRDENRTKE